MNSLLKNTASCKRILSLTQTDLELAVEIGIIIPVAIAQKPIFLLAR